MRALTPVRPFSLVLVAAVVAGACGGDDDEAAPIESAPVTAEPTPETTPPATIVEEDADASTTSSSSTTSSTTSTTTTVIEPEVDLEELGVDADSLGIDPCVVGEWWLDNNSYAEVVTAITGVTASASGIAVLTLFIEPARELDDGGVLAAAAFLLDEHFGFTTEIQEMGASGTIVLDATDLGTFATEFEESGSGVLTGLDVYSLGTDNRVTLSAGDATVTMSERVSRVDVPGYVSMVAAGTGEVSGWEDPRSYLCSDTELLFVTLGAPPIRYTRTPETG